MAPHYCLLQVLLLALAALRAGACDITEMGPQTEAMNEKCCADGACNGAGVPSTCSASCAPVFETFWKDCGAYLNYLPIYFCVTAVVNLNSSRDEQGDLHTQE